MRTLIMMNYAFNIHLFVPDRMEMFKNVLNLLLPNFWEIITNRLRVSWPWLKPIWKEPKNVPNPANRKNDR